MNNKILYLILGLGLLISAVYLGTRIYNNDLINNNGGNIVNQNSTQPGEEKMEEVPATKPQMIKSSDEEIDKELESLVNDLDLELEEEIE